MQRLQKKVQATRNAMTNVLLCEMKIKKSLILQLTIKRWFVTVKY